MSILLQPYKRVFDFSGRSRRKEYWLYILVFYVLMFGLCVTAVVLLGSDLITGITADTFIVDRRE